jgi:phage I-like protein
MLKKLILKLGLQPEATEDEVLALVAGQAQEAVALKLQTAVLPELAQAVGLEATATPAQIKGAVLALKQGQEQLTTLQTEVAALKAAGVQAQAAAAVDEALKAGKLAPAQQEWALEYAARDLEGFKVYVEKAPKVVPVEALKLKTKDGKGEVSLTPEELTVCKSLGVAPEAFKAQKDQQAAA